MKWFKFYGQDYLSDPKILTLTAGERSCWLTLLAYGSIDETGMVVFLDENKLMLQSGIDPLSDEWSKTRGVLEKLKNLKMITLDNGMITLVNWSKRQETNLTSYERVKRWRNKNKDMKHNDNAMITSEENRIEENRREENTNVLAASPPSALKYFYLSYKQKTGHDYIANFAKDGAIFKDLLKIIPEDEIRILIDRFLDSDDEFIRTTGRTIGVFRTQINKLRTGLKPLSSGQKTYIACQEAFKKMEKSKDAQQKQILEVDGDNRRDIW